MPKPKRPMSAIRKGLNGKEVLSVACPACHAKAWEGCEHGPFIRSQSSLHTERFDAAALAVGNPGTSPDGADFDHLTAAELRARLAQRGVSDEEIAWVLENREKESTGWAVAAWLDRKL